MKRSAFLAALFLMSALTNAFNLQLNLANAEAIVVPGTYLSIQEAINHAEPGDAIYVKAGVYFENIIIETNGLKIVGEDQSTTIIDGQGNGTVVYVKANNTVFSSS